MKIPAAHAAFSRESKRWPNTRATDEQGLPKTPYGSLRLPKAPQLPKLRGPLPWAPHLRLP